MLHAQKTDSSIHMATLRPWEENSLDSKVVTGYEELNLCESLSFPCDIPGGVKSLNGFRVTKYQRLRVKKAGTLSTILKILANNDYQV